MSGATLLDAESRQRMIAWINVNGRRLHRFQGEFVAYNEQGVIVHDAQLGKVIDEVEQKHVPYMLYLVPKYPVPLRVGSLRGDK